jgi:hypothetical protein
MLCNRPAQIPGSYQSKAGGDLLDKPAFISTVTENERFFFVFF